MSDIIVKAPTEREWQDMVTKMWRAGVDAAERHKDSPEKFARALKAGGNFGLQLDYDAAITRLRTVSANHSWNSREAIVIVVMPPIVNEPGHVNDYLLGFEDVRLVEDALRSRVRDYEVKRG